MAFTVSGSFMTLKNKVKVFLHFYNEKYINIHLNSKTMSTVKSDYMHCALAMPVDVGNKDHTTIISSI